MDQSQEVKHTYLDTVGRPVLVLHKKNVVPDHDVLFKVTYSFFSLLMLREPALLITAFALLFAGLVAYSRCEFTISRDEKWQAARQQENLVAAVQQIAAVIAGDCAPRPPLPPCWSASALLCAGVHSVRSLSHVLNSGKLQHSRRSW